MHPRPIAILSLTLITLLLCLSWPLSYSHPHGLTLTFHHRYAIWCSQGFIQFRTGTRTDVTFDSAGHPSLLDLGYDQPYTSSLAGNHPSPMRWDRKGPSLTFSLWRPIQHASVLFGGQYPDPKLGLVEFGDRMDVLAIPHWLLNSLFAIPLAWLLIHRYKTNPARRRALNLCPTCAYDLRASTNKCPECGTPIPSKLTPSDVGFPP